MGRCAERAELVLRIIADTPTHRCVKKIQFGHVMYVIWENIETQERHISCYHLTFDLDTRIWSSTEYLEKDHPPFDSCLPSYLDMVPVQCPEWREEVIKHFNSSFDREVWEAIKKNYSHFKKTNSPDQVVMKFKEGWNIPEGIVESIDPILVRYKGKLYKNIRKRAIIGFEIRRDKILESLQDET